MMDLEHNVLRNTKMDTLQIKSELDAVMEKLKTLPAHCHKPEDRKVLERMYELVNLKKNEAAKVDKIIEKAKAHAEANYESTIRLDFFVEGYDYDDWFYYVHHFGKYDEVIEEHGLKSWREVKKEMNQHAELLQGAFK